MFKEKFSKMIFESENVDDIIETLNDKCSKFITHLKLSKPTDLFYSGRSLKGLIVELPVRKDRRPRNTSLPLHNKFDELFKKKFGIKARSSSIFVTADENEASSYGEVYYVFPIGNYKIIWSKYVKDLFEYMTIGDYSDLDKKFLNLRYYFRSPLFSGIQWESLIQTFYGTYENLFTYEIQLEDKEEIEKWKILTKKAVDDLLINIINTYEIGNLKDAIEYENEVMLVCDNVLMINKNQINLLLNKKFKKENKPYTTNALYMVLCHNF